MKFVHAYSTQSPQNATINSTISHDSLLIQSLAKFDLCSYNKSTANKKVVCSR